MARRSTTPAPAPGGPRARTRTPVPVRTRRTFGDVMKALCAVVALAVLVVGVPVALAYVIGWPLPHQMPSLDTLRDEVSAGVFIDVLTVVVWLAWAQFTACVLVEVKGAVSGVGLPARVPGAGPSQMLARQLVAAALLLGSTAGSFAPGLAQLGPGFQPHHQQTVAAAELTPGAQHGVAQAAHASGAGMSTMGERDGDGDGGLAPDGSRKQANTVRGPEDPAGTDRASAASSPAAASSKTKFYRIQPPQGRHHDSLWEVAERHLNDGRRYKEIYRLNKDRVQPDGSKLSEASLIRPGWIMEMPADAHGGELVEMPDDAREISARERGQYEAYQNNGGDRGQGDGAQQQQPPRPDGTDERQQPDDPGDTGQPGGTEKPDAPEGTEKPDAPGGMEKPDAPEGTEDPGRSEQPDEPGDQRDKQPDDQPDIQPGDQDSDQPSVQPGDKDSDKDSDRDSDKGGAKDESDVVPPVEHTPDRQEQSVPEAPGEQSTRPDELGLDTGDEDGLPGPGIPQPDVIRPGAPGTSPDVPDSGSAQERTGPEVSVPDAPSSDSDSDSDAHEDADKQQDGKGGKGDDSSSDLANAGLPDSADGTNELNPDQKDQQGQKDQGGDKDRHEGGDEAQGGGLLGSVGLPETLLGAPLLAAGVLAALGRRRRAALWQSVTGAVRRGPGDDFPEPSDPAAAARDALLVGADPEAVRFLDRALRGLAEDLTELGRPLPVVYAAWLSGQELHLQLAEEYGAPPAPWRFGQSPSFWTIQRVHTRVDVDGTAPAPYPGLVSLGLRGSTRLLLNLEAVPGLVSVAGSQEQRTSLLASVAAELATGSWSEGVTLTLVGFGAELTALAPDRMRHLATVAELLREGEDGRSALRTPHVVLVGGGGGGTGSRNGSGSGTSTGTGTEPDADEAARLAELASDGVGCVVGLPAGALPGTVWEFEIGDDGTLVAPQMGLEVRAQLLPEAQRAAVVELFAGADGDGAGEAGEGPAFRVDLSDGGRPAVYARLMGPYEILGLEEPEESRSALLHEALALLLLHREGVHPRVLASALWPKGVTDDVCEALIERLRRWLGIETDGTPRLGTGPDGRLVLRPSVVSDWDVLRTLHHGSTGERGARLAPQLRRRQLADALELARGPLFSDRPEGRYGWLAYEVTEAQHPLLVAETGLALAAEHLRFEEPEQAVAAVRAALRSAAADERLWEQLLRTAHATGDPAELDEAVRWVTERSARLHGPERGMPPRTAALLDELAPGHQRPGRPGAEPSRG